MRDLDTFIGRKRLTYRIRFLFQESPKCGVPTEENLQGKKCVRDKIKSSWETVEHLWGTNFVKKRRKCARKIRKKKKEWLPGKKFNQILPPTRKIFKKSAINQILFIESHVLKKKLKSLQQWAQLKSAWNYTFFRNDWFQKLNDAPQTSDSLSPHLRLLGHLWTGWLFWPMPAVLQLQVGQWQEGGRLHKRGVQCHPDTSPPWNPDLKDEWQLREEAGKRGVQKRGTFESAEDLHEQLSCSGKA